MKLWPIEDKASRPCGWRQCGFYVYFARHWQIYRLKQKAIRVALEHSRLRFPAATRDWAIVASIEVNQCVVFVTYRFPQESGVSLPGRYFLVQLPEYSCSLLPENFRVHKWGPFI